ncbi:hypothetical protein EC973_002604 [Apophysomyces ossiformis]|uniref:PH domain-containing protein n=1 Tax=Apophysomyces ossiformis TaxID=679940 RepID=A0A8H7ELL5_9FUNG|nr:hypothetical protein EC973_002604 [Apophysomyces ossiformis]
MDGVNISYVFQARTLKLSQAWYMALYRRLPSTTAIDRIIDLTLPFELQIKIPLPSLTKGDNIRTEDVKACVLAMLELQGKKPPDWHMNNVGFCWRNKNYVEWFEQEYLIGPQVIEQAPSSTEGFLISHSEHYWRKDVSRRIYAIADHHFLFLLDPSKSIPPADQTPPGPLGWLSAASFYRSGLFQAKAKKAQSSPRFFTWPSYTTPADINRRTRQIPRAYAMIDLSTVDHVRMTKSDQSKCFELCIGAQVMRYEASSAQEMFEWVMRLRKLVRYGKECRSGGIQTMVQASLWHCFGGQPSVLQFGPLYVKHSYHGTFRQRFCVLVHNKILIFSPFKRRPWTQEAVRCEAYPQVESLDLQQGYVYAGEECLKDQDMDSDLPPRFFQDTVSNDTNADCVFVLWQRKRHHAIAELREYARILKLGHRLGRKGKIWVFLARNSEEKEAWIWALHRDMDYR